MEKDESHDDTPAFGHQAPVPPAAGQADRGLGAALRSRKLYLRLLAVAFVIAITASIFVFRDQVEGLETYGYLGAFLISLITSATIILPVPGIVLIAALGAVYNPVLIGVVAGGGSALGEITGYLAGYSGQVAVENRRTYQRLEGWMRRRGLVVILVLSFVPNPLFDLAGGTSGILKYPMWKFLVACFLGKTARFILIALGVSWIAPELGA
jgi:membrane protein YqaA with SNARE-associated domain